MGKLYSVFLNQQTISYDSIKLTPSYENKQKRTTTTPLPLINSRIIHQFIIHYKTVD